MAGRFDGRRTSPDEEIRTPTLCQRCTSGRQAQIDYGAAGWLCWACYEEMRSQSPADAELERRLDANPQWQRQPAEAWSEYRKRMLAEWRGMRGVGRVQA